MRTSLVKLSAIAALLTAATAMPAQAAIVFSDTFNGPGYALNTPPAGWTVVAGSGSVDWIQDNTYGLRCYGNTGGCVDLDGSTNNAGIMTTGTYTLVAGTTYTLSAYVSGNQRGATYPSLAGPDTLTFGFRNGSGAIAGYTQTVTNILAADPYTLFQLVITPTVTLTGLSIFFDAAGGDNVGPMLDNVMLTAVPLPAAAWLLLSGLVGFAALGRRRTIAA